MQKDSLTSRVLEKIDNASNILVAVSKEPTMDELAAAVGLTIMLDGMGKHATAIFSGTTPSALGFLEPEKTFEADTNSLQDFIIALDKDKADHLRYRIDGDYVKVFITPYKTTIDEHDLEFSHGDFNIDLMIALGVSEVEDLDGALYEHGKILHDADAINISNGTPGKFGEIQWADPAASSVSEMVAGMAFAMKDKVKLTKTVATAFLTGIVANTGRFLNEKTTPKTMDVASRLMQAGANQQLISANLEDSLTEGGIEIRDGTESGELEINNDSEAERELDQMIAQPAVPDLMSELATQAVPEVPQVQPEVSQAVPEVPQAAPEMNIAPQAAPITVEPPATPELTVPEVQMAPEVNAAPTGAPLMDTPPIMPEDEPKYEGPKDYGQMMEEALAEPLPNPATEAAPVAPTGPELNHIPDMEYVPHTATTPVTVPTMGNEFLTTQPDVQLPPPPMPPVPGMEQPVAQPVMPEAPQMPEMQPVQPIQQPVPPVPPMQPEQTVSQLEQANDPGAFKIPGM